MKNIRLSERIDPQRYGEAEGDGATHQRPRRGYLTPGQLAAQMGVNPERVVRLAMTLGISKFMAREERSACLSPELISKIREALR